MAAGSTVRRPNAGRGGIFHTFPDPTWGPTSLLYEGYWVFHGGKERGGVRLTAHLLLVPWSGKSRAIQYLQFPYGPYGL